MFSGSGGGGGGSRGGGILTNAKSRSNSSSRSNRSSRSKSIGVAYGGQSTEDDVVELRNERDHLLSIINDYEQQLKNSGRCDCEDSKQQVEQLRCQLRKYELALEKKEECNLMLKHVCSTQEEELRKLVKRIHEIKVTILLF